MLFKIFYYVYIIFNYYVFYYIKLPFYIIIINYVFHVDFISTLTVSVCLATQRETAAIISREIQSVCNARGSRIALE